MLLLDKLQRAGHLPTTTTGMHRFTGGSGLEAQHASILSEMVLKDMALSLELVRRVNNALKLSGHAGETVLNMQRAIQMIGLDGLQLAANALKPWPGPLQPVAAENYHQIFEQLTTQVVATLDDQADDIAAIAECARAGGRQFRFAHDFLIWDLDGGRTPARQRTFAARQTAVRNNGGDFVDLYDAFHERAGLTWFNDFIHPSAVGQRMIAELLCTTDAPVRTSVAISASVRSVQWLKNASGPQSPNMRSAISIEPA